MNIKDAYKLTKAMPYILDQRKNYIDAINKLGVLIVDNIDNPLSLQIATELKEHLDKAVENGKKIGEVYGEG